MVWDYNPIHFKYFQILSVSLAILDTYELGFRILSSQYFENFGVLHPQLTVEIIDSIGEVYHIFL
jgi:hypothetical protein